LLPIISFAVKILPSDVGFRPSFLFAWFAWFAVEHPGLVGSRPYGTPGQRKII
jgi:hypothetical protein